MAPHRTAAPPQEESASASAAVDEVDSLSALVLDAVTGPVGHAGRRGARTWRWQASRAQRKGRPGGILVAPLLLGTGSGRNREEGMEMEVWKARFAARDWEMEVLVSSVCAERLASGLELGSEIIRART